MSKFKLKIADREKAAIVPEALGVPLKRTQDIAAESYKGLDPEADVSVLDMLDSMIEQCETLEEVVAISFCLGGYQEQEMSKQESMIANALEHAMEHLTIKPTAEA